MMSDEVDIGPENNTTTTTTFRYDYKIISDITRYSLIEKTQQMKVYTEKIEKHKEEVEALEKESEEY